MPARELDRLGDRAGSSQWGSDSRLAMTVRPLADVIIGQVRPAIWVLGAAALLVFLVAVLDTTGICWCTRLERRASIVIRRAIARRARWHGSCSSKTLLVVGLAGMVGCTLAWMAWRVLPTLALPTFPAFKASLRSIGCSVALGLGFLATLVLSVLPALSLEGDRAAPPGWSGCRGGQDRHSHLRVGGAIAVQVALAVVTLVASLLLVRTLHRLERRRAGLRSRIGFASRRSRCSPPIRRPSSEAVSWWSSSWSARGRFRVWRV